MRKIIGLLTILAFAGAAMADWSEDFTTSPIGTGRDGSYVAGTDWTVTSNYVRWETGFTPTDGYLRIGYNNGSTSGQGPGGGAANTATVIHTGSTDGVGTYYALCKEYRQMVIFNYQDANNYYFVIGSTGRQYRWNSGGEFGGGPGNCTTSFGMVLSGTTLWIDGHDDPNGVTVDSAVGQRFDFTIVWDPNANTVDVTHVWYDNYAHTESGSTFTDPNYWESGNMGIKSSASSMVYVTDMSYVIPEPATVALLGLGACLPLLRKRR